MSDWGFCSPGLIHGGDVELVDFPVAEEARCDAFALIMGGVGSGSHPLLRVWLEVGRRDVFGRRRRHLCSPGGWLRRRRRLVLHLCEKGWELPVLPVCGTWISALAALHVLVRFGGGNKKKRRSAASCSSVAATDSSRRPGGEPRTNWKQRLFAKKPFNGAAAIKRRPTRRRARRRRAASRPLRRVGAVTGPVSLSGRTAAGGRAARRPGRLDARHGAPAARPLDIQEASKGGVRRGVSAARPLGVQEASKGAGSKQDHGSRKELAGSKQSKRQQASVGTSGHGSRHLKASWRAKPQTDHWRQAHLASSRPPSTPLPSAAASLRPPHLRRPASHRAIGMPSPRLPLASPCHGRFVLLLVPALLLLSSAAHSAEESKRVLSVGKELVGETMPLRHGRRVYRVDGLRPSAWYEVKISYPASIPSSFSIRLVDDPDDADWSSKNRRLLNTEKIIFKAEDSNPVYVLVTVEPEGVVAKPNVQERELALFNIVCDELMLGIPVFAWWVGIAALLCIVLASLAPLVLPLHKILNYEASDLSKCDAAKVS
ncbi:uncharacterized protein LOC120691191 isoform X2 [Panicum virgatum]|uniref:uncharacterized protein LOC120691191 isoform X2 n=1 Tax=Panicum virgatum TaxID=38727 RepID=UPI0019D55CFF|nr:uncharacterized protein LOC120691191 isoform X2 [Panicum virgatum]